MKRRLGAATLAAALGGCAVNFPQTAEELRKAAPEATFGKTETLEINRPFRQVASTFQRKAPECPNISVRMTERSSTSYLLVADAYPLAGNRTRLQWFGPSRGHDTLIRAVKGWATGENPGCPDLTKP